MLTPKILQLSHPSGRLYEACRQFSENHPQASFFQSGHFIRFMERWPEAVPVLLVALNEDKMADPGRWDDTGDAAPAGPLKNSGGLIAGSMLAVIVHEETPRWMRLWPLRPLHKKLTSRCLVYGGPLLAPGSRLERELTLKALIRGLHEAVRRRALFTQFRNFYDMEDFKPVFRSMGFRFQERLNLLADTSSPERAWNNMTYNRRREVRLSRKHGATIVTDPEPAQVDDFYHILHQLYKKKVRKPLPSRAFFHAIAAMEHGLLLLVGHQGRIIGGLASMLNPGRTAYEWYACGLDREYRQQQVYPSVLATWAALEYAAENNIPQFDFMGMGKPDTPYGVREFKKRFGGTWVNFGRFSRVNNRFLYFIVELAYNLHALCPRR